MKRIQELLRQGRHYGRDIQIAKDMWLIYGDQEYLKVGPITSLDVWPEPLVKLLDDLLHQFEVDTPEYSQLRLEVLVGMAELLKLTDCNITLGPIAIYPEVKQVTMMGVNLDTDPDDWFPPWVALRCMVKCVEKAKEFLLEIA